MAITARLWTEGEVATAAKFNTIRDDLLELDAVAGFFNAQYGAIVISQDQLSADATVSAMSARAIIHYSGHSQNYATGDFGVRLNKISSTVVRATRSGTNNAMVVAFVVEDPRG